MKPMLAEMNTNYRTVAARLHCMVNGRPDWKYVAVVANTGSRRWLTDERGGDSWKQLTRHTLQVAVEESSGCASPRSLDGTMTP